MTTTLFRLFYLKVFFSLQGKETNYYTTRKKNLFSSHFTRSQKIVADCNCIALCSFFHTNQYKMRLRIIIFFFINQVSSWLRETNCCISQRLQHQKIHFPLKCQVHENYISNNKQTKRSFESFECMRA